MSEKDQEQFMKLLVEGQAELAAFVRGLLPFYPDDVEDVVQNTNCALILHTKDFDPARPFRPWMFAFARRQVLKFCGTRAGEPVVFDDALAEAAAGVYSDTFPGDPPDTTERLLKLLAHCKGQLSPQHRELLDKRYQGERSIQEIAREQHENAHNVVTRLAYIRKLLHDCVTRLCRLSGDGDGGKPAEPTPDESFVNDVLENLRPASRDAARLSSAFRQDRELLRYWLAESRMDSLLRMEASRQPVVRARRARPPVSFRGRRIAAAAAVAAGLALLLGGGILWKGGGFVLRRPAAGNVAAVQVCERGAGSAPFVQPVRETARRPVPAAVATARPIVPVRAAISSAPVPVAEIKKEEGIMKIRATAVSVAAVAAALAADVSADGAARVFNSGSTCALDTRPYADTREAARNGWLDTRPFDYVESAAIPFDTKTPTGTMYSFH